MSTPGVSVIMPAYNHEKYVGEAIESVLNQTFRDFEFIIINDGSTDGTDGVIRSYDDPRICYYTQENIDAPQTINRGFSLAKGRYISIINSDDVYPPERLAFLTEIAESTGARFVITGLEFINDFSEPINDPSHPNVEWYERLKSKYLEGGSIERTFLIGNLAVTSSNFFFKAEVLRDLGQLNIYKYVHDYDFVLRSILEYRDKFHALTDEKHLLYRVHSQNTLKQYPAAARLEVFELLINFLPDFMQDKKNKDLLNSIKHIFTESQTNSPSDQSSIKKRTETFTNLIYMIGASIKNEEDKARVEAARERMKLINDFLFLEDTLIWKFTSPLKWIYYNMPSSWKASSPIQWLHSKFFQLIKN